MLRGCGPGNRWHKALVSPTVHPDPYTSDQLRGWSITGLAAPAAPWEESQKNSRTAHKSLDFANSLYTIRDTKSPAPDHPAAGICVSGGRLKPVPNVPL